MPTDSQEWDEVDDRPDCISAPDRFDGGMSVSLLMLQVAACGWLGILALALALGATDGFSLKAAPSVTDARIRGMGCRYFI